MNIRDLQLLRVVKYQVVIGLAMLVGFFTVGTVLAQTSSPMPTMTPTVTMPKEAPSTGHAE